jgi:hypothetical protein
MFWILPVGAPSSGAIAASWPLLQAGFSSNWGLPLLIFFRILVND